MEISRKIIEAPSFVRSMCANYEAWIVGGAARVLVGMETKPIRDWDILIPTYHWGKACLHIPSGSKSNDFGGHKFYVDGAIANADRVEVDMWCGDIGWFLSHASRGKMNVAVNLFTSVVLTQSTLRAEEAEHCAPEVLKKEYDGLTACEKCGGSGYLYDWAVNTRAPKRCDCCTEAPKRCDCCTVPPLAPPTLSPYYHTKSERGTL